MKRPLVIRSYAIGNGWNRDPDYQVERVDMRESVDDKDSREAIGGRIIVRDVGIHVSCWDGWRVVGGSGWVVGGSCCWWERY
jgi:hypothetical protein